MFLLTLNGQILQRWYDERLTWNRSAYDNIQKIFVNYWNIWQPELTIWDKCVQVDIKLYKQIYYVQIHYCTKNLYRTNNIFQSRQHWNHRGRQKGNSDLQGRSRVDNPNETQYLLLDGSRQVSFRQTNLSFPIPAPGLWYLLGSNEHRLSIREQNDRRELLFHSCRVESGWLLRKGVLLPYTLIFVISRCFKGLLSEQCVRLDNFNWLPK